jgi:hypothetical protein
MKTTVDLPEALIRKWKKRAAEQGMTLKKMWTRVLSESLRAPAGGARSKRKIRWVTGKGGLPPGLDVSNRDRMYDWVVRHR